MWSRCLLQLETGFQELFRLLRIQHANVRELALQRRIRGEWGAAGALAMQSSAELTPLGTR